jgi:hypothetical protein
MQAETRTPCDLHVLGTPPAFVLSQDQTRHSKICLAVCLALHSYVTQRILIAALSEENTAMNPPPWFAFP